MKVIGHPGYDDDLQYPEDDEAMPHCYCPRGDDGWSENWRFCTDHQSFFCVVCDGVICPYCDDAWEG